MAESDWLTALEWTKKYVSMPDEIPWLDSPWKWWWDLKIAKLRGTAAEKWVAMWLSMRGLGVTKTADTGVDLLVNGVPMEIKSASAVNVEKDQIHWQQLRDQPYKYLLFLGIWPHICGLWVVPKAVAMEHATPQHCGVDGTDTHQVQLRNPFDSWLRGYGGTVEEGYEALIEITGPTFQLSGQAR